MKTKFIYFAFSCLFAASMSCVAVAQEDDKDQEQQITVHRPENEDPSLKNVLLLGDDVMFAYEQELVGLIGDKANCTFISMPQGASPDWDAFSEEYIQGLGWDVIHFSYGRELMLHVDADGHPVEEANDGMPLGDKAEVWGIYESLIKTLGESDAFLIGCTTTPVRGNMSGYAGDVDWTYGSRFKQLLGPNGVKINDLADYTRTRRNEMVRQNSNLPTDIGEQLMAEQVANNILEAFNEGQNPDRPRILIVGDSIVGGYYGATRNLFGGSAAVYSGGTTYNDPNPNWKKIVDQYIKKGGDRGWDVIQFNWGLHAVKYVDENNKGSEPGKPGAHIQFTPEEYVENLEAFVNELKRTGATLVFATTTPIPKGSPGSIRYLDLEEYNGPAKAIMGKHGILVNDLYSFAMPRLEEIQIKDNVHFHAQGSEELAKQNYSVLAPLLD
ncbi:SGNH/GDSL hydrolase family protein [Rubellicoccus peritrichatus]|uniref:SGNH/GDSL hydrolase family protein n=1 Tax=Rubellicoccus peritrichatus TaxID=3080537 RepID=A0AAQ3L766_9BACT|nr:SGNH/GDSL hydrolase family protein [Puniceicoccus sp. CR14]WOO40844.1 SGNH/GDSL hydrolase family protein [Puniceicoccus sp. CR14]